MGLLRLYLALCVIAGHANVVFPWMTHDARQAVQIFYLISGFYMELILSKKYNARAGFYANRLLRIFIPYWIVLVFIVGMCLVTGIVLDEWMRLEAYETSPPLTRNGLIGFLLAGLTNLTLFFQDWVMFLQHDIGEPLQFTKDFRTNQSPLYQYLVFPQGWTIGIELTFYMIVPWLHRWRSRSLLLLLAISMGARIFAYEALKFNHDPWNYRFFPFEVALFLLGMLGYRLSTQLQLAAILASVQNVNWQRYLPVTFVLLLSFWLSAIAVHRLETVIGYHYAILVSYVAWAGVVPFLFVLFGRSSLDRWIGELSYPVYLIHFVVIDLLSDVWPRIVAIRELSPTLILTDRLGVASAVISVLASAVLYLLILQPFEKRRHAIAAWITRQRFLSTKLQRASIPNRV